MCTRAKLAVRLRILRIEIKELEIEIERAVMVPQIGDLQQGAGVMKGRCL
jgi:hypothetical protein